MIISLNRINNQVEGINLPSSPLLYSIEVNDDFDLTKTIEIEELVQKKNENNELLYKKIEEIENEIIEIETIEETDQPILISEIKEKIVSFKEDMKEFNAGDILQEKYQKLLDESEYDLILADIFLNEEDIDLTNENHYANTGVALLQLLPFGQAQTKLIELDKLAQRFEILEFDGLGSDIFINDIKAIDHKVILNEPTNKVIIKFINNIDKPIEIKSYAIGY